jgi:GNAT superfamily N-acetyltransferase
VNAKTPITGPSNFDPERHSRRLHVRRRKPRDQQRKGFGSILLADALDHASEAAKTAGSVMAAADALNATGDTFYTAHGFVRLPHSPRLILPTGRAGMPT